MQRRKEKMGKRSKQGAALRAKKRANAAALELVAQSAADVDNEVEMLGSKRDDELFVLDTVGDGSGSMVSSSKKRQRDEKMKKNKKHRISEKDERQIKRLISLHGKEGIVQLNEKTQMRVSQKKKSKRLVGTAKATFDLWDDNATTTDANLQPIVQTTGSASMAGTSPFIVSSVPKQSLRKDLQQPANLSNKTMKARRAAKMNAKPTVAVEVAQPGQSYCPDIEHHQDTIGEALSIELRRNEILQYNKTPISNNGLSEDTLKVMVNSSDDEDSDKDANDSQDEDDENIVMKGIKKDNNRGKLTKAQRNKQRRVREEQRQLKKRKSDKKFLSSLSEARHLEKQLKKEEAQKQNRRNVINTLKEEEKSKPLGVHVLLSRSKVDPLNVPSIPVALSDEVKSAGLRTVKPKGSLLTDRVQSMMARNMINGKATVKKAAIQGKKRKIKPGKHREFLLT